MTTLYLVSPLANKKESEDHCFKSCGKIIVGGIDFLNAPWLPCREQKCPHKEKELKMGEYEIFGKKEKVIVRKLTPSNIEKG